MQCTVCTYVTFPLDVVATAGHCLVHFSLFEVLPWLPSSASGELSAEWAGAPRWGDPPQPPPCAPHLTLGVQPAEVLTWTKPLLPVHISLAAVGLVQGHWENLWCTGKPLASVHIYVQYVHSCAHTDAHICMYVLMYVRIFVNMNFFHYPLWC